ncbi:hypothetical protein BDR07DRAFT_1317619, partial [Suillus spraguei]
LRNPYQTSLEIDSSAVRHAIATYFALEHSAINAYESIRQSAMRCLEGEATQIPSYYNVERLIAEYTGVESIEHDTQHCLPCFPSNQKACIVLSFIILLISILLVDPGTISRPLLSTDAMPLHPDQDSEPGTSANICVPSPIDDCLALKNTRITPTYPRDASAPPFGVHLPQPTPQGLYLPRSPLRPTVSTSENKTLPTCHTPGTSQNIQLECADKENEIILQDPL